MINLFSRFRISIALVALPGIMLCGCLPGHRVPPPPLFQFTFEPPATPAGARYRVHFYIERIEWDESRRITRFMPKGSREVGAPSGSPSLYRWDALMSISLGYQGGRWQGRAQVWRRNVGGGETYIGEGMFQFSLPYEQPTPSVTQQISFRLEPAPTTAGGFRVVSAL
jgi:hypothetical protein